MADRTDKLLLLDTASLYFRAFFGVPDTVKAPDGTPVNAIRGLLDMIAPAGRPTPARGSSPAGTTTGARVPGRGDPVVQGAPLAAGDEHADAEVVPDALARRSRSSSRCSRRWASRASGCPGSRPTT